MSESGEGLPPHIQQFLGRYGVEPTMTELDALDTIRWQPSETPADYAQRLTTVQGDWPGEGRHLLTLLAVMRRDFRDIVTSRPPAETEAALDVFIQHGQTLRQHWEDDPDNHKLAGYHRWLIRVNKLAGLSKSDLPDDAVGYSSDLAGPHGIASSEQFWLTIYKETPVTERAATTLAVYALGPNIEKKDPAILMDIVDAIEAKEGRIEEVFAGSRLVDTPDKLIRQTFDSLRLLCREAAAAGWGNAAQVGEQLTIYARGKQPHAAIVLTGNAFLRAMHMQDQQLDIEPGVPGLLEHVATAIGVCQRLIFEYGEQPKDHDPLNYLLFCQIISTLCPAAERLAKRPRRS